MEHIDRISARVTLCAFTGVLGGATYATYIGYPLRSTSLKAGGSCAIVATALFGFERLGYVTLRDQINSENRLILTSHAFAGVAGGGLNGYLYQKKPLRGMFFFIPIMLGVGGLELFGEEKKQARIRELVAINQNIASQDRDAKVAKSN